MDSPTHNYHGQVPNYIGTGYNQEYTLSSTPITTANNTRTNDNYLTDSTNSNQQMIQHEPQYYSSETQVSANPSLVSYPQQQSMPVPAYNYNYNYMIPMQAAVQASVDPSPSSSSIAYYSQQPQQQQISLPPPLPQVTSSSSMVPVNYNQFVSYPSYDRQSNSEYQQDVRNPPFIQQQYAKPELSNYMFRPVPMVDLNASKLPRATLEQKIEVLDWFHASTNKNQQATVDHFLQTGKFTITKSTLNRWLMGEDKLRDDYSSFSLNFTKNYKTKPKFKDPEVTRCLEILYEQSCNENSPLTEKVLVTKWSELTKLYHNVQTLNKADQTKSNGWLHHFKKRHSVQKALAHNIFNDAELNQPKNVQCEISRLRNIIGSYKPSNVYQLDEVSFSTKPTFLKGNNDPSIQRNGLSMYDAENILSVSLMANSDGSSFLDPLIISSDPAIRDVNYPTLHYNKNGILSSEAIYRYLKYVDSDLLKEKSVLLMNTHNAHIIPLNMFQNLRIVYFSTHVHLPDIQPRYRPFDFGLKRIFKTLVKLAYIQNVRRTLVNSKITPNHVELEKQGMIQYIMGAATSLQTKESQPYVAYGFYKSGLTPSLINEFNFDNSGSSPYHYGADFAKEEQIVSLLKDLQERGFLSDEFLQASTIDIDNSSPKIIEELLFPEEEKVENKHFTERDVVIMVKRERSSLSSKPSASSAMGITQNADGSVRENEANIKVGYSKDFSYGSNEQATTIQQTQTQVPTPTPIPPTSPSPTTTQFPTNANPTQFTVHHHHQSSVSLRSRSSSTANIHSQDHHMRFPSSASSIATTTTTTTTSTTAQSNLTLGSNLNPIEPPLSPTFDQMKNFFTPPTFPQMYRQYSSATDSTCTSGNTTNPEDSDTGSVVNSVGSIADFSSLTFPPPLSGYRIGSGCGSDQVGDFDNDSISSARKRRRIDHDPSV
ncbi:unnamed protein product [Ambrosiozyma monospora]|uniref:Unnamed protein product n=1 Tax=Ambrosiozyma monospora TaxID=43982 RepID=A0A9W6YMN4_AMBMO|nr:unnamed protein product [Ambrosiozyma monospora]